MKAMRKIFTLLFTCMLVLSLSLLLFSCDDEAPTPPPPQSSDIGTETVKSIEITTLPTRTVYFTNEDFDSEGMVVTATLDDGSEVVVSDYRTDGGKSLTTSDKAIHVYYGGRVAAVNITVSEIPLLSVDEARVGYDGEELAVFGYYLGKTQDGEFLIKDTEKNVVVEVFDATDEFEVGDLVRIKVTLVEDNSGICFAYSADNATLAKKVVSTDNEVVYNFENATGVASWRRMTSVFGGKALEENSPVKIYGSLYVYVHGGDYYIHMNGDAKSLDDIKTDGTRVVKIDGESRGAELLSAYAGTEDSKNFPGKGISGEICAFYVGSDEESYNILLADSSWLTATALVSEEQSALVEVAYAYYYKGNKIHYDQYGTRRNINPSPELATSDNRLHLDCSSYVNAVYYEAFGENVMPYPTTERSAQTGVLTNYAEEFLGINPDVIGYWENANYTTEEEKAALLSEIKLLLEPGDVIVYRRTAETGHAIIYVGGGYFLHSTGSSYEYDTTNPLNSYDQASNAEISKGTVSKLSVKSVFDDPDSGRYLFTSNIARICLLRPLARGLSITEQTKSRLTIPGISIEKTSSAGYAAAVSVGSPILYTITMTNNTDTEVSNITVKDKLPIGTEFIGAGKGISYENGVISWYGTIPANTTVNVVYCVVVTKDAEAVIESYEGTVNGVKLSPVYNTRAKYSGEDSAKIAEAIKNITTPDSQLQVTPDPIALANLVYSTVGENVFEGATAKGLLDALIDSDLKTYNASAEAYSMLVPTLYGGYDIRLGYRVDNERSRLVKESNVSVGDVIIAESGEVVTVYVYAGEGNLLSVSTADLTVKVMPIGTNEYKNVLMSLISYDRYVILRPSMLAD